jgi:cysteine desulfurase
VDLNKSIYLDNAATTPILPEVKEAMLPYLGPVFGNPSSTHSFGRQSKAAIELARKEIAQIIGSSPGEIYFTSGGTEANNMAFKLAVDNLNIKTIISSPIEHHSVLHSIEGLEDKVKLRYVNLKNDGEIDLDHLEELLEKNPNSFISLMHANNEIGNLLPIKKVSWLAEKYDAIFHSDAVQTVGHYQIDLKKLNHVHFLSASAHKFHGPKGTGFLFIRSGFHLKSFIKGGPQERELRAGTENIQGIIGMAKALELANKHNSERQNHISKLKKNFTQKLKKEFPGLTVNGLEKEDSLYAVLNVSFPFHDIGKMLPFSLDLNGIAVSSGSACASGANDYSHVLKAINKVDERPAVRFSFSHLNTDEELDETLKILKKLMK